VTYRPLFHWNLDQFLNFSQSTQLWEGILAAIGVCVRLSSFSEACFRTTEALFKLYVAGCCRSQVCLRRLLPSVIHAHEQQSSVLPVECGSITSDACLGCSSLHTPSRQLLLHLDPPVLCSRLHTLNQHYPPVLAYQCCAA